MASHRFRVRNNLITFRMRNEEDNYKTLGVDLRPTFRADYLRMESSNRKFPFPFSAILQSGYYPALEQAASLFYDGSR